MGIAVGVLLALEQLALLLQHHHQLYIQAHVFLALGGVVSVLHKLACILAVGLHVHICLHPFGVKVVQSPKLAGAVHHGSLLAVTVVHQQVGDAGLLGHADDAEGLALHSRAVALLGGVHHGGLHPGDELLVGYALQGCALALFDDAAVQQFRLLVGLPFGKEVAKQGLGHDNAASLAAVGVGGLHQHIVDGGTHTQCRVRRQCPRSGSPRNGIGGHFR